MVAQDTARGEEPSVPVTGQVVLEGSEVSRLPAVSTAAQKVVAGHDTEIIAPCVST